MPRIEYHPVVHAACVFPVVQQVVGAATFLSSCTRRTGHLAQQALNKVKPGTFNEEKLNRKIQMDYEGMHLAGLRFIPAVGSVVSGVILLQLDKSEGGRMFEGDKEYDVTETSGR